MTLGASRKDEKVERVNLKGERVQRRRRRNVGRCFAVGSLSNYKDREYLMDAPYRFPPPYSFPLTSSITTTTTITIATTTTMELRGKDDIQAACADGVSVVLARRRRIAQNRNPLLSNAKQPLLDIHLQSFRGPPKLRHSSFGLRGRWQPFASDPISVYEKQSLLSLLSLVDVPVILGLPSA